MSVEYHGEDTNSERRSSLIDFGKIDYEALKPLPYFEGLSKCITKVTKQDYFEFLRFVKSGKQRLLRIL